MTQKISNVWILKSKGDESSFGGNEGYADKIDSYYVYDTTVKNHNKIAEDDLVIISEKKRINGFARITSITTRKNVPKKRYRCPVCNTQEHYERKNVTPRYKCRKKHLFDTLIVEDIIVDQFTLNYSDTWVEAPPDTFANLLDKYYVKRNRYYSIQAATFDFFHQEFPGLLDKLNITVTSTSGEIQFIVPADVPDYDPTDVDSRKTKTRDAISREGQGQFREMLFRYYGRTCMVTGCKTTQAIEAGHINPYRGKKDNHPANGLLLRKDIHAIFDSNLLGIDPDTLTIHIHPLLNTSEYEKLHGQILQLSRRDFSPSAAALKIRWLLFNEALKK